MKRTKYLPVIVVVVGLLVTACGGLSLAPAALSNLPAQQATLPGAAPAATPDAQTLAGAQTLQSAYETIYQNVSPSVVTIEISSQAQGTGSGGFGFGGGQGNGNGGNGNGGNGNGGNGQIVPTALGSGFVWDGAGHIVTNNHVVEGAAKMTVTFPDGASYDAKLVGTDPNTDLAVIQVTNAPGSELKPIAVGDSTQVKVGEMVVAIGNPFGLANTMTTGIVSAISRSIQAGAGNQNPNSPSNAPTFSIPDVIQTDAAINPGNSGGVLVDMSGALIGVPSQIESQSGGNTGVGFAIPSSIVKQVVPQLISKGSASHSYLGISGITISPDVVSALNLNAGQQGILIATIVPGGPAEKAGLKPATVDQSGTPTAVGDIITGINGKTINRFEDLVSYLYNNTQPGQTVTLNVLRGGKEIQVPLVLGTQPKQ